MDIKWKDVIIDALKELGGHGSIDEIYNMIKLRGLRKMSDYRRTARNTISGTLESFSKDSDNYKGKEDLFYSVYGIAERKGCWGLNDFEPTKECLDLTEDDEGFSEGKSKLREHIFRERNYKVIALAKREFLELHGELFCEVCNFNFYDTYGELGKDYIEGHHIIPVSQIPENYKTQIKDIAMVCSNCHKMLHRKKPWLTHDDLKKLLNK